MTSVNMLKVQILHQETRLVFLRIGEHDVHLRKLPSNFRDESQCLM